MASLIISLDFEMFWGVSDSKSISDYGANVLGEWEAIPRMLSLFESYDVKATWATVGMLMCRDYAHWRSIVPSIYPGYYNSKSSTYNLASLAKENPKLFFGRSLVERIIQTPGQELGGHSYSHFYCAEHGATAEQFSSDLFCMQEVVSDFDIKLRSFVFPRNQIRSDCLNILIKHGYDVFRGNPQHWLYSNGHGITGGHISRALRLTDSYIPISRVVVPGSNVPSPLVDCTASYFLRPWSRRFHFLERFRIHRLQQAMLEAVKSNTNCHIWWHPHNFGKNIEENLVVLESLLAYYRNLRDQFGMKSENMGDFSMKDFQ